MFTGDWSMAAEAALFMNNLAIKNAATHRNGNRTSKWLSFALSFALPDERRLMSS